MRNTSSMSLDSSVELGRSAHVDTFCRDHLPDPHTWPELVFDLPELHYPDRLNCAVELLDAVVARLGPDRRCLVSPSGDTWTYGQLLRTANQLAHVLRDDVGIVPGNRVLLRGPNNAWLAACWFAVLKVGAVAVTTMPLLRPAELTTIAEIARIDLALCDRRFVDDLRTADLRGAAIRTYGGTPDDDLTALAATAPADFDAVDTAADDVAPLAFTFGLGGLLVFPLRVGAATLLLEKATPDELADAIAAHEVTVCFTAPTGYRAMLATGNIDRLRTLRRAVAAGEHLPRSTWQAFHDATGVKLIDGIGSTEMLHVFVSAADDDIVPGATGRPVPGFRATVVDDAGTPVPPGTAGRLAVKGPTGCRYLADDRQAVYVQHGWNITGDTFVQDERGYFYFQARDDDMIVSSGYNIAGPEVEEALLAHPSVVECCVVGVPDAARGQLVKAYVVLPDGIGGDDALVAELQAFTKAGIAPYKYPRAIEFVTTLPRTSTGKIQRFVLRAAASQAQE
jgi:2-aminobenzoate-CoA ligase